MNRLLSVVLCSSLALLPAGCSSGGSTSICDKSAQNDLSSKAGDCVGVPTGPLLGTAARCAMTIGACSDDDRARLSTAIDCVGRAATCTAATREAYLTALVACYFPLATLSQACRDGVFGGALPGDDAGVDAGVVDAGPQPIADGGNGVELLAVVDGTDVALAWLTRQPGDVATWQLVSRGAAGPSDPEVTMGPGAVSDFLIPDSGLVFRRFFVVGRTAQGEIAAGSTAVTMVDAGMAMCASPLDCPVDRVCDLGRCVPQSCMLGSTTCPGGYQCLANVCTRTTSDAGGFDAGFQRPDAGSVNRPLPFISNEVALMAGAAGFSGDVTLGGFAGRRPSVAAIDTARAFVALEQEGQLVAHASSRRGQDFVDDALTSFPLDTVGTRVQTTYNRDSKLLFACYTVGRGVRVQRSTDFGRTWGLSATTVEPADDGGVSSTIQDCDIAPWTGGGAIMVTVEDDALMVRTISSALSVGDPVQAFAANPSTYFNPQHPAIATLPAESVVHVTFTGTRTGSTGVQDSEPLGVYRDGTLGAFTQAVGLGGSPTGITNMQDWTTVAIDPTSKRALAAFVSIEPGPGNAPISTVYTSLWNPMTKKWGTSSDLNVFAAQQNTTLLFPQKAPLTDTWFAFSPSVVALPSGKMWLSFVVGSRTSGVGDYRMVAVPFDFDLQSPLATAKGWYVRPVVTVSTTRVIDPRGSLSAPQPPVSSLAADHQLSIYGAFIQGLGTNGEVEGRGMFFSRP
jgi:hypothetical protein